MRICLVGSRVMGRSRQFAEEQEYAFATFDVKAGEQIFISLQLSLVDDKRSSGDA